MSKLSTVGPRLLVLACVALATSTRAQECVNGVPERYPHPTDCNLFYACVDDTPVGLECPAGLWYNPTTGNCDYPENVNCAAATSTTTSSTTTSSTTTSSTATSSQIPTEGPPSPPRNCPAVDDPDSRVRYAHETDCKLYYLCLSGNAELYTCHDGDEFSPLHKICNPINEAGCSRCPVEDVEGEDVQLPHETACHYYYLCKREAMLLFQCPGEEHFSRIDRLCMSPIEAYCQLSGDEVILW